MQIALDNRTVTEYFPGIGRYTLNLARAMQPLLGEDERLVLLRDPARALHWGWSAMGDAKVQVIDAPVSPFTLRQQWVIPRLLRRLQADVYHSPYYLMPYRPGVPAVVTIYDLIPALFPGSVSFRARLLFRWATALALRAADRVVVISQATRRDLLSLHHPSPARITAIPLAASHAFRPAPAGQVDQVRRRYGLPDEYVLYLGINKPHKNLVRLIDAFSLAGRQGLRAGLVIAGAWDDRYPEPRLRAQELGLQDSVRFLGPVPEADLPPLYSGAASFVFPSLYEGFGLPVLEAMACGTPVACSDAPSLSEVAGDAALYFDPLDVASISRTLCRLLGDERLQQELRARGLVRKSRFSWERTAQETLDLYRGLVHRGLS